MLRATFILAMGGAALFFVGCSAANMSSVANSGSAAPRDDTAFIQQLVDAHQTIPAGNYVTRSGIVLSGDEARMQCAPGATITFLPASRIHYVSDRAVLTNCDTLADPITHEDRVPRRIASAIAVNDTSFTATDDVSDLHAGDWLIVWEGDNTLGGVPVIMDWVQVASVTGDSVNVVTPFRTAFPNIHTWKSSPCCGGLGFYKVVGTAARNVTISGCSIVVPDSGASNAGLAIMAARHVTVDNTVVTDFRGQPLYSWLSKDVTITNSIGHGYTSGSEFGGTVDLSVSHTNFSAESHVGFFLDLGTSFFDFIDNTVTKSNFTCLYLLDGVHDGIIQRTKCPYISVLPPTTDAIGIWSLGSQRVSIVDNDLSAGGSGSNSTGLIIRSQPAALGGLDFDFPSFGNTVYPNTFAGWYQNYDPNNQP